MLFGTFLAVETRKVHLDELNDSQAIGVCIYNIFILSIVATVVNMSLGDITPIYLLNSAAIIVGTMTTQIIVFLPRMKRLHNHTDSMVASRKGSHISKI